MIWSRVEGKLQRKAHTAFISAVSFYNIVAIITANHEYGSFTLKPLVMMHYYFMTTLFFNWCNACRRHRWEITYDVLTLVSVEGKLESFVRESECESE